MNVVVIVVVIVVVCWVPTLAKAPDALVVALVDVDVDVVVIVDGIVVANSAARTASILF